MALAHLQTLALSPFANNSIQARQLVRLFTSLVITAPHCNSTLQTPYVYEGPILNPYVNQPFKQPSSDDFFNLISISKSLQTLNLGPKP